MPQKSRRAALAQLLALSAVPVLIQACGVPGEDASRTKGTVEGRIALNHGHVAKLTDAQQASARTLVLDITGTSNHPHTVTLTSQQLHDVAAGHRVIVMSTTDGGHAHRVTFN